MKKILFKNKGKVFFILLLIPLLIGLLAVLSGLGVINIQSKSLADGNLNEAQAYFVDYRLTQQNEFSQLYMDNVHFTFSKIKKADSNTGTVDIEITYPDLEPIIETAISGSVNKSDEYGVILSNTAKKMKELMKDGENNITVWVTADVIKEDKQWKIQPNNEIRTILGGNLTDLFAKFLSKSKWGEIK